MLWVNAIFDVQASNVLDSRTIWVDGRYRVFLPVLDMANNKDHPERAHRTVRNPNTGASNTPAIWDVAKGEQLFENYNTPNHDNLLCVRTHNRCFIPLAEKHVWSVI